MITVIHNVVHRIHDGLRPCCTWCEGGGVTNVGCSRCHCHTGRTWPLGLVVLAIVGIVIGGSAAGWQVIAS